MIVLYLTLLWYLIILYYYILLNHINHSILKSNYTMIFNILRYNDVFVFHYTFIFHHCIIQSYLYIYNNIKFDINDMTWWYFQILEYYDILRGSSHLALWPLFTRNKLYYE